ncbi:MAG: hypothetical protein P4L36_04885 [Holophaga sp.]|nr:hypothetical protein [Holophaga sp.]
MIFPARSILRSVALALAAGAALQAGTAFVAIANQSDSEWSLMDIESSLTAHAVELQVLPQPEETKDEARFPAVIGAQATVVLQLDFPGAPPELGLYLARKEGDLGMIQGQRLALDLSSLGPVAETMGSPEAPLCTFTIRSNGTLMLPGQTLLPESEAPESPGRRGQRLDLSASLGSGGSAPASSRTPGFRGESSPYQALPTTPAGGGLVTSRSNAFRAEPSLSRPSLTPVNLSRILAGIPSPATRVPEHGSSAFPEMEKKAER